MTAPNEVSIYPSGTYGAPGLCLSLRRSASYLPSTICDYGIMTGVPTREGKNQEKMDLEHPGGLIIMLFLRWQPPWYLPAIGGTTANTIPKAPHGIWECCCYM